MIQASRLSSSGFSGGSPSARYAMVDTWANLQAAHAATPFANDTSLRCTDIGVSGMDCFATGGTLRLLNSSGQSINVSAWRFLLSNAWINFGGGSATYSQSGTTVTVLKTSHGFTSDYNGASIFLTGGTGTFVTETCTNFEWVDANTFRCTSATSRTDSGNLGTNTAKTYLPFTYTYPTGLIKNGDVISASVWRRCNNNSNNKTVSYEFGGVVINTQVRTTNTAWVLESSSSATFTADNKFLVANASASESTISDNIFRIASTLANAADWDLIMPVSANYAGRSFV